jgi:hypothetical protein
MILRARLGGTRTRHPSSFPYGAEVFFRQLSFRNLGAAPAVFSNWCLTSLTLSEGLYKLPNRIYILYPVSQCWTE